MVAAQELARDSELAVQVAAVRPLVREDAAGQVEAVQAAAQVVPALVLAEAAAQLVPALVWAAEVRAAAAE